MGHLLGEGRIRTHEHTKTKFLLLKMPWQLLGNNFSKTVWTPPPKWPSQISFLSPNRFVNLRNKQSLPPAYSRHRWVWAPSNPIQGGDQAPSSTLPGGFLLTWVLSSPAAVHYLLPCKGIEKQNPSRRARRFPPSRRFVSQGLRVVPNGTCLLKVRSFLAHAPNVVATRSEKQTHSEGQCR